MNIILNGLPGVQCNQDDLIITGKDDTEHLANLRSVLSRLKEYGLKANLEKCAFFKDEIIFCGMKISKEGLHKTNDKVLAVMNSTPNNKSQLRSFLGMVNYYHKWLKNIAQIAKPLYNLLQDKVKFVWDESCTKAFETIKTMIASDNVLIRYDQNLPVRLACDASPYGIGAVLSHVTKSDAHTKWAEVFPVSSTKSSSTIDCLTETFSRLGILNIIASDNGSMYTSNEFKDFTKRNGIKHITTAPFHRATNGLAERNAPQSTTHESPAFLKFGRRLQSRLDLLRPNMDIQNRLTKNYSNVRLREFQVGDSVLARDYRANQGKWQYGVIKSKTGPLMYIVEIYPGMIWRRHIDQLVSTPRQENGKSTREMIPTVSERNEHFTSPTPDAVPIPSQDSLSDQATIPDSVGNNEEFSQPQVEYPCSPTRMATHTSPTPRVIHSEPTNPTSQDGYITRSGREVQKPHRYNE
ncbi:hypothetical protein Bpfe_025232 [Biomphalaria pfeifferi]|uniref:Integrase catalytic domain-containing protein n=1 Tax=Biomphalaria pfeifferi TaxID=112525 RepID=A0AAD8B0Y5_BIOPF|nr:hypothetical protein Bpfe_025232 [Biomphalaria pfeifferi]